MIAAIALLYGMLNAGRGGKAFPFSNRFICALGMQLLLIIYTQKTGVPSMWWFLSAGFFIAFTIGTGKYFMAIHGEDRRFERECPVTDWLLDRAAIKNNYLYGAVGMSLRWMIWTIPLFVMLLNPLWLGMALVGPIYWLAGRVNKTEPVRVAEFATGALLGFLLLAPY